MLLLTDGSVFCQEIDANVHPNGQWHRFLPHETSGNYAKGGWDPEVFRAQIDPQTNWPFAPMFCASAVLKDGRVFIAGGEYNGTGLAVESPLTRIFDPTASPNKWTVVAPPKDWIQIGDAPCCVLPDGRVLLGHVGNFADAQTMFFDPANAAKPWSQGPDKANKTSSEESWVLLRDGTIITVNCDPPYATQLFVPPHASMKDPEWKDTGPTPDPLVDSLSSEIGPGLALPDGSAAFVGATGYTAVYTPDATLGNPGKWSSGPSVPQPQNPGLVCGAKDAPACLLPNGRILIAVTVFDPGLAEDYGDSTLFYEWDPGGSSMNPVDPSGDGSDGYAPYFCRMLQLPSGQVLFTNTTKQWWLYESPGSPQAEWRPTIDAANPKTIVQEKAARFSGTQFNGLSQCSAYGDDVSCATNYPIARLKAADGSLRYCRTSNHSTMAIATGPNKVSTEITVPKHIPPGPYDLQIIANGIESAGFAVTVVKAV